MNLTFKNSISVCHKIVTDSKGKKYLMDTSTIRPNVYGFGFLPKRVFLREYRHIDTEFYARTILGLDDRMVQNKEKP